MFTRFLKVLSVCAIFAACSGCDRFLDLRVKNELPFPIKVSFIAHKGDENFLSNEEGPIPAHSERVFHGAGGLPGYSPGKIAYDSLDGKQSGAVDCGSRAVRIDNNEFRVLVSPQTITPSTDLSPTMSGKSPAK